MTCTPLTALSATPGRFASPPVTLRRTRPRAPYPACDANRGGPRPRRRGSKRRRSGDAPVGRVDGVAMDSAGWTTASPHARTDGVATNDRWPSTPREPIAPPSVCARVMLPWPGQGGAQGPRRRHKIGKCSGKVDAATAGNLPAPSPMPEAPASATIAVIAAPPSRAPMISNFAARVTVQEQDGINPDGNNHGSHRDQDDLSPDCEVPDSLPMGPNASHNDDTLSGQSGASTTPAQAPVEQSTAPMRETKAMAPLPPTLLRAIWQMTAQMPAKPPRQTRPILPRPMGVVKLNSCTCVRL
ncbi:hypothetical protein ZWY2020_048174 [Hordeum vulgare]|nr:hypothetical protein ZWY2020_048174 [Hordeum vulgare]